MPTTVEFGWSMTAVGGVATVGIAILIAVGVVISGALPLGGYAPLILAAAILFLVSVVWSRRAGLISPVPMVALTALLYLPLRGLLLVVFHLSNQDGVNVIVTHLIDTDAEAQTSMLVLYIALGLAAGSEVIWRLRPRRLPDAQEEVSASTGKWPLAVMGVGLVCQAAQIDTHLTFLQGQTDTGGFLAQLVQLGGFGLGLGIVFLPQEKLARGYLALVGAMVLVGVVIGLASGSKEILFEIVLAILLSNLLPAFRMGRKLNRQNLRTLAAVAGIGALLILVAFPAISAFRRQVQDGASFPSAIGGTPGEMVQDSIILGTPRADPSFVGYLKDAGLYATNRTSGFDELLITVAAPPNPQILTTQSLLLMPLGTFVPSSYWSTGVQDVGLYFAQNYWGSLPDDNTYIAMTVFGQAYLAFGTVASILAAFAIGALAGLAGWYALGSTPTRRGLAFIFLVAALTFERDVLNIVVPTERRLILLGLMLLLFRISRERYSRVILPAKAAVL
jgi:hypothetical protein